MRPRGRCHSEEGPPPVRSRCMMLLCEKRAWRGAGLSMTVIVQRESGLAMRKPRPATRQRRRTGLPGTLSAPLTRAARDRRQLSARSSRGWPWPWFLGSPLVSRPRSVPRVARSLAPNSTPWLFSPCVPSGVLPLATPPGCWCVVLRSDLLHLLNGCVRPYPSSCREMADGGKPRSGNEIKGRLPTRAPMVPGSGGAPILRMIVPGDATATRVLRDPCTTHSFRCGAARTGLSRQARRLVPGVLERRWALENL